MKMHVSFLNKPEMKAIDNLKSFYGGAKKIGAVLEKSQQYAYRKNKAEQKGFGNLLNEAEGFTQSFPKVDAFKKAQHIKTNKKARAITQVSGWQGAKATHEAIIRLAADGTRFLPYEMISVMALTDNYVYGGGLTTTLAMCENLMGAQFCTSSLVGTPLPAKRFNDLYKATGVKIETLDAGNGFRKLRLVNQGTPFGNLCGVEVSNDHHLVYLDSITRTALETGCSFFLNPSWSTIAAACYYGRDIPGIIFKISMLLSTQNTVMLRMLINIMKEYIRKDGTTPIYEINIGNAVSPKKFVECREILDKAGLSKMHLAAHIVINPDLGAPDFNWFDNGVEVLKSGCDIIYKYESDGQSRPYDTMAAYFISEDELEAKAGLIGDVIYHKVVRCDKDAKALMKMGYPVQFAGVSVS